MLQLQRLGRVRGKEIYWKLGAESDSNITKYHMQKTQDTFFRH